MVEWLISPEPVPYLTAMDFMDARVEQIKQQQKPELVWLLEHENIYTYGTGSDNMVNLAGIEDEKTQPLEINGTACVKTNRGGKLTWHGKGQRVVYVLLNLNNQRKDLHAYLLALTTWVGNSLNQLGLETEFCKERVGLWCRQKIEQESIMLNKQQLLILKDSQLNRPTKICAGTEMNKIVALGVRVSGWVTSHGLAINVNPDLTNFSAIHPCGINDSRYGVTSLWQEGIKVNMVELDRILQTQWQKIKFLSAF